MILTILAYLGLIVLILFIMGNFIGGGEQFTSSSFVEYHNVGFGGMNLLGVTSNEASFGCDSADECRSICADNNDCAGYSYYQPGRRCFLFASGNFIEDRPGYISGKRT